MKQKLTDQEFNLVLRLTHKTLLDEIVDIKEIDNETDQFWDFENDLPMTLQEGFEFLTEANAYPFQHENFSDEEAKILKKLIQEFVPDFSPS